MKLEQIQQLEKEIMKEVVKRRGLGGYSAEAEGLLILTEAMYKVVQHLREEAEYPDAIPVKNKKAKSA